MVQNKQEEWNKLQEAKIQGEKSFKVLSKELEQAIQSKQQEKDEVDKELAEARRCEESLKQELAKAQIKYKDLVRKRNREDIIAVPES
mmetsp:Transcript_40615/g.39213  ORF Transcript_40615/g.39213 Transcript_40615/m.39213 type:complete len:88 (+) Transcript_40615:520-783(+)